MSNNGANRMFYSVVHKNQLTCWLSLMFSVINFLYIQLPWNLHVLAHVLLRDASSLLLKVKVIFRALAVCSPAYMRLQQQHLKCSHRSGCCWC